MPLSPINVLAPIQSSPELNKTTQNEANRPQIANQHFSEQMQKETRMLDQQIMQTSQTEGRSVDADGKGNNGGSQSRNRNKRKSNEDQPKKTNKETGMFDVSI